VPTFAGFAFGVIVRLVSTLAHVAAFRPAALETLRRALWIMSDHNTQIIAYIFALEVQSYFDVLNVLSARTYRRWRSKMCDLGQCQRKLPMYNLQIHICLH